MWAHGGPMWAATSAGAAAPFTRTAARAPCPLRECLVPAAQPSAPRRLRSAAILYRIMDRIGNHCPQGCPAGQGPTPLTGYPVWAYAVSEPLTGNEAPEGDTSELQGTRQLLAAAEPIPATQLAVISPSCSALDIVATCNPRECAASPPPPPPRVPSRARVPPPAEERFPSDEPASRPLKPPQPSQPSPRALRPVPSAHGARRAPPLPPSAPDAPPNAPLDTTPTEPSPASPPAQGPPPLARLAAARAAHRRTAAARGHAPPAALGLAAAAARAPPPARPHVPPAQPRAAAALAAALQPHAAAPTASQPAKAFSIAPSRRHRQPPQPAQRTR
jgi:hypothetical protein